MPPSDDFKRMPRPKRGKAGAVRLRAHATRLGSPGYHAALAAKRPETVVKVAGYLSGTKAIRQAIQYVARLRECDESEVRLEKADGTTLEGKEAVNQLARQWQDAAKKSDGAQRKKGRDAAHIILSAGADLTPENVMKTRAAALAVARKHFSEAGYDFALGMHQDGGYPHAHLIVRCTHRDADLYKDLKKAGRLPGDVKAPGKLRIGPADLLAIRRDFAHELTRLGLEHKATLKRDRPLEVERARDSVAGVQKSASYFERQLEAVSPSYNSFAARKEISARVVRIREHVKKVIQNGEEKKALLQELRAVEKSIKAVNMQRELPAALRRIEADIKKLPVDDSKRKESNLERQRKELDKGIDAARRAISGANDMTLEEKRSALETLREYELSMRQKMREAKSPEIAQARYEQRVNQLSESLGGKTAIETREERRSIKQEISACRKDPHCTEAHQKTLAAIEQRLTALTVGPAHARLSMARAELEAREGRAGREAYVKIKEIADQTRKELANPVLEAFEKRALGQEVRQIMNEATRGYVADVEREAQSRMKEIERHIGAAEQGAGGSLPAFRQAMNLEQRMMESREFVTNLANGLPLKEREALAQRMEGLEKAARARIEAGITHIEDRAANAGRDRAGYQARWEAQKCREIAGVPLAHTKTRERER